MNHRQLLASPALLIVLLGLAAPGCNDSKVTSFNTAPSALISYPSDGQALAEGQVVALEGVVGDDDSPPSDLTTTWRIDGVDACAPTPADEDGGTRCEVTLPVGSHELSLVVEDPGGQAAQDTVTVTVEQTAPPSAVITSPEDDAVVVAGELVALQGQVADLEDGASELTAWWTVDGVTLDVPVTVDSDGDVTASTTFTEAASHTLSLQVEDSDGKTASATITLTVQAAPGSPSCEILSPASGAVVSVDDGVDLQATASDPDQAPETLSVAWSSDIDGALGSSTPSSAGAIAFSPTLSQADHTLSMVVTDATGLTCSDYVTVVVDEAPSVEITSPAGGTLVQQGAEVTVSVRALDARDPETELVVTLESDLDGALASGSPASDGDLDLPVTLGAGTHTLTVTATDSNGFTATDSLTMTVNGAPSTPVVDIDPSGPRTDDALTASLSTASVDPEGDAVSYTWSWTKDGASTSYSSTTVPASATAKGELWEVTVVARDGDGGQSGEASARVTIQDTAPALTSLSLTPSRATVEDDLSANAGGSDVDGDTVSFRYAWTVDGVAIPESDAVLTTGYAKGDVVVVTVTPVADGVEGEPDSASLTIRNAAPGAPVVDVSPEEPYAEEDALTCEIEVVSSDPDGDAVSYDVAWTVDGVDAGVTGYTVDRDDIAPGELWVCTVTPSDGEDEGPSASASVTVLGDPVDYAHVQYPCSLDLAPGADADVYGWVYKTGVTGGTGAGPGISSQVGYGDPADDPSDDGSTWTWFDGAYFADKDGLAPGDKANDEHLAVLVAPTARGTYAYAYRFSTDDGASWIYADLGEDCGGLGTVDGFDVADAGVLTVD